MTLKRKALSSVAALALALSMLPVLAFGDDTVDAVGEEELTDEALGELVYQQPDAAAVASAAASRNVVRAGALPAVDPVGMEDGFQLSKSLGVDEQGGQVITLEAYATGNISLVSQSVPCDIVLVLDQSGSMRDGFGTESSYRAIESSTNRQLYRLAGSEVLYVLTDDGYVPVNVERDWNFGAVRYQYTYTWAGQDAPLVSLGQNTVPSFDVTFYVYEETTISRLAALKSAASSFIESVRAESLGKDGVPGTEDDVHHRIAMAGFASGARDYENTELFIGSQAYGYGNAARGVYGQALQDMATQQGYGNAVASIGQLDANGGTHIDLGLEMAEGVFMANPVPEGQVRSRVTVVLTDGAPGDQGNDPGVANSAIQYANTLKSAAVGSTVYSVGIFPGADATGALPDRSRWGWNDNDSNRFMHLLSSNYPSATNLDTPGPRFVSEDGSVPDFYLSAADASGLNAIFQSISEQIGGSSVNVGAEAVVRDVLARGFALPEGADASLVKTFTQTYLGESEGWSEPVAFADANVSLSGQSVDVTGFDFSTNWVGMEERADGTTVPHGAKLVVTIPFVRTATFGGTGYTNENASGVYAAADGDLLAAFEQPVDSQALDYRIEMTGDTVYWGDTTDVADNLAWAAGYRPDGKNNALVDLVYELTVGGALYRCTVPAGTDTTAEGFTLTWKDANDEPVTALEVLPAVGSSSYALTCTVKDAWQGEGGQPNLVLTGSVPVEALPCSVTVSKQVAGDTFGAGDSFVVSVAPDEATVARYRELAATFPQAADLVMDEVRAGLQADGSVTVAGLPVGTYRVIEDANWSWRYRFVETRGGEPVEQGALVTLPTSNERPASVMWAHASLTLVNTLATDEWLSHETAAVNTFDVVDGVVTVTRQN